MPRYDEHQSSAYNTASDANLLTARYEQVVAELTEDERVAFIRRTYTHLAGAVVAFTLLLTLIFSVFGDSIDTMAQAMFGSRISWLVVLVAFIVVGKIAEHWAQSAVSRGTQYMGLGLYVVAEVIIFIPLISVATRYAPDAIPIAAVSTILLFGVLTGVVFTTRKDFSFLRPLLVVATFGALIFIVGSLIMGFSLGVFFAVCMVVVMCGWILYQTSNILLHYRVDQDVAAALGLFAALATLFWYVLIIVMNRR
ncbi:MAG: US12 family protein [Phycisphaeraceae bacterium]|nr:US12 family protein [Phycisphaeraceae bacterium]